MHRGTRTQMTLPMLNVLLLNDANPQDATSEYHDAIGRQVNASSSKERRSRVGPDDLARRFCITRDVAAKTLNATTQRGLRLYDTTLDRRFKTQQAQLRFPRLNTTFTPTRCFLTLLALGGETCAQVMLTSEQHSESYPMKSKSEAGEKLNKWIHDHGIPRQVLTDGAKEETYGTWGQVLTKFLIPPF